jgi:hypothetical protein
MNVIEKKYDTGLHNALQQYKELLSEVVGPYGQFVGSYINLTKDTFDSYWDTCLDMYSKYMASDIPGLDGLHTIRVFQGEGWVMIGLTYWGNHNHEPCLYIAIEDELLAVQVKLMM